MKRATRIALTASALSFGPMLAGCENFDPTAIFDAEIFNTKKKLPGERRPVFPEGTPGVPHGVPAELVKGYEPPETESPPPEEPAEAKAKPKAKPKPKVVAKPKEEPAATSVTVRPEQSQSQPQSPPQAQSSPRPQAQSQPQWPDPPPMQRQPAAGAWPGAARTGGGVAWPDPPAPR
jgi:outer membrane biosynthesis protein TonB